MLLKQHYFPSKPSARDLGSRRPHAAHTAHCAKRDKLSRSTKNHPGTPCATVVASIKSRTHETDPGKPQHLHKTHPLCTSAGQHVALELGRHHAFKLTAHKRATLVRCCLCSENYGKPRYISNMVTKERSQRTSATINSVQEGRVVDKHDRERG